MLTVPKRFTLRILQKDCLEHILGICQLLHMQNTDFLYHIRIQLYGILYFLFTLHTVIIPLCLHYTAIFETMFVLSSVMAVSIAVMRSLATTFTMVIPLHTVIAVFIQLVSSITVFTMLMNSVAIFVIWARVGCSICDLLCSL